jgi:hypothetical protein
MSNSILLEAQNIIGPEISLIYHAGYFHLEKTLRDKSEPRKDDNRRGERYTIFHALFEALKEKDRKHKER